MDGTGTRARRPGVLFVQRPSGGGSMTGLLDLLRALDRDRFRPEVLLWSESQYASDIREIGAPVHVLGNGGGTGSLPRSVKEVAGGLKRFPIVQHANRFLRRDVPRSLRIREVLQELAPDVVHHNDNPRGDRASILAAALTGIPQVCHVRFIPGEFSPVDPLLIRTVDRFIYMSEAIREGVGGALSVPEDRARVVYDPFDFEGFEAENDSGDDVRRELGLDPDARLITNVGRLVEWKGQDVFVEAAGQVLSTHPDAHFLLVGEASGGGAGEGFLRTLKGLAERLEIEDRVHFTGFRRDVARLMAASEMVVHSAVEPEPFGRVLVEALAARRPLVATAAGGPLEIIDDRETGLLVTPGDPREMAEAMRWVLDHPDRAVTMARRGGELARRRYSPERFADEVAATYDALLTESTA